jgi:hypothetical protein
MSYKVVESSKIVWCDSDDRYILIVKEDNEIVGLNYCQGDDFEFFKDNFNGIDKDLTNFFNAVEPYLVHENQIDRINAAIWAHFEYRNLRDE